MVVLPRLGRTRVLRPACSTDFSGQQRLERPEKGTLSAQRIRQDGERTNAREKRSYLCVRVPMKGVAPLLGASGRVPGQGAWGRTVFRLARGDA